MQVTVSPKFQVAIPLDIRKELNIRPGEKFEIIPYEGRLELVPVRDIKEMRGFLKGMDTLVEREEEPRL
ncbi:MAG: AbrB family transcriptional regulator [bacterium (Candidatus Ratteibacteria) CG23_combo_of_CG06-09_8_20_14_all_48_7]|uniref:AbrB family transcriptional regulator n=1 Tax=bacterium (Candidatus Ratteibacteria) CG23_combo_of_CG06-09_8_20_14_all_48_7 TaxID=2014292 RepID=A0A2G9YAP8_9BACT|nr:MAG: AbrB family transcriptional regulator [bacterium (Candidatus Ratteibacteria) CG23_combo_of_CG06-09_8_20_14_all_48_7]